MNKEDFMKHFGDLRFKNKTRLYDTFTKQIAKTSMYRSISETSSSLLNRES